MTVPATEPSKSKTLDTAASHKRKLLYRRLKATLMGLTALTLLLMGCLLGFVIPATLHVKGKERLNSSAAEEPNMEQLVENFTDPYHFMKPTPSDPAWSWAPFPTGRTSSQPATTVSSEINSTSTLPAGTPSQNKWWHTNLHDRIAEARKKYAAAVTSSVQQAVSGQAPITDPTPKPQTTNSPSIYKWWIYNWKDHVENALQKQRQWNSTGDSGTGYPINHQFKHVTNYTTTPNNQLAGTSTNGNSTQSPRPNVRRVTSYPQQNITTTAPSVITRRV